MIGIVQPTGAKRAYENGNPPIAPAAQRTRMAVTGTSQLTVMLPGVFVPLHANASPVITGFPQSLITALPHLNPLCLSALLGNRSNTGIQRR